jgi:hypothetical protein
VATTGGSVGAGDVGSGATLGGGVTVGEGDGLTGGDDGVAAGATGPALHAANTTAATRAAPRTKRNLDIVKLQQWWRSKLLRRHS